VRRHLGAREWSARPRYVDEGANFHSHTYAKYGGEIIKLPGMFAWQVFDSKVTHLLRGEYRIRRVTKVEGNTLEELAHKLDGVDAETFLRTVRKFNAACRTEVPFNPNILDGRKTECLPIDKTNWANPLDTPPFQAMWRLRRDARLSDCGFYSALMPAAWITFPHFSV
jgi:tricarballylate dehydrogenase